MRRTARNTCSPISRFSAPARPCSGWKARRASSIRPPRAAPPRSTTPMIIPPSPHEVMAAVGPATVACGVVPPHGMPPRGSGAGDLTRALFHAGIVHELGARGPRKFDCYSAMQLVQFWLFGRETIGARIEPDAGRKAVLDAISTHEARRLWKPVKGKPAHGDIVSMTHVRE